MTDIGELTFSQFMIMLREIMNVEAFMHGKDVKDDDDDQPSEDDVMNIISDMGVEVPNG